MPDKPIAKRAKKNKGVGCPTPMEQRLHTARDNRNRSFATEYLRTMSAAKAGRSINLAEKTLKQSSWHYLRKPAVQKIIQEEFDRRTDAAGVTQEWIINKLKTFADASLKDFAAWDGHDVALVGSGTATREELAPVKEVSSKHTRDGVNVNIKLHDSVKALELLAKIKGMISTENKNPFTGKDVKPLAERLMQEVEDMREATAPGKDSEDGECDEGPG